LISVGGTVTNRALQAMIDGITLREGGTTLDSENRLRVDLGLPEELEYDPAEVSDERERKLSEHAMRLGQDKFRTRVLTAYSGACSLTGSNAVNALEAAHITPYLGPETNVVGNGICLRADMHRLWDSGLVAIDEDSSRVLLSEALLATSYRYLEGQKARLPRQHADRPSRTALAAHRQWCGLVASG
jgi:predicted restriction endonuclease